MSAPLRLAFEHLNLKRNPFGALTDDERAIREAAGSWSSVPGRPD